MCLRMGESMCDRAHTPTMLMSLSVSLRGCACGTQPATTSRLPRDLHARTSLWNVSSAGECEGWAWVREGASESERGAGVAYQRAS